MTCRAALPGGFVDAAADEIPWESCSDAPRRDAVTARIRAFEWSCVLCGLFLALLAQGFFELAICNHEAEQMARPSPRRRSFTTQEEKQSSEPQRIVYDVAEGPKTAPAAAPKSSCLRKS